jgi:protein SCO1/2
VPGRLPDDAALDARNLTALGDDAGRVQVLFVTLDPARDTPSCWPSMSPPFTPASSACTATRRRLRPVAKDFKVFYARQAGTTPGSYSIDHSTGSYVFDPQGRLRLLVRHGETPTTSPPI